MTAKERVLASRLVEKVEYHGNYARLIGVSGRIVATDLKRVGTETDKAQLGTRKN